MVRKAFRGKNIGLGGGSPVLQSDDSKRILQQGQDYIDDLKQVRDLETQYMARYISDYDQKLSEENNWSRKLKEDEARQAKAIQDQYVASLQSQQRATQAITGRAAGIAGSDPKTDDWLNFVLGVSKTAADSYKQVQEQNKEVKWDQGVAKTLMFPVNPKSVAFKRMLDNGSIMSATNQTMAAALEAGGGDPQMVEEIRKMDSNQLNGFRWGLSVKVGKQMPYSFQEALTNDSEFKVKLPGPDGSLAEVPLNQINQNNVSQLQTAWMQYAPHYYRENGFGDARPEFLAEGMTYAKNAFNTFIADKQKQATQTHKNNTMDESQDSFTTIKTPQALTNHFQNLFNIQFNGDRGAARQGINDLLKDINIFPDDAEVEMLLKTVLPGTNQSMGEKWAADAVAIRDARREAVVDKGNLVAAEMRNAERTLVRDFIQSRSIDMQDGVLDNETPEGLMQIYKEAKVNGMDDLASTIEASMQFTPQGIRQGELEDQFEAQMALGQPIDKQQVLKAQGVSNKWKKEWLAKTTEVNETLPPKSFMTQATNDIKDELSSRLKYYDGINKSKSPTLNRAIRNAERTFIADYQAAIRSDPSESKAYDYAIGRFHDEFGDDETKGKYAILGLSKGPDGNTVYAGYDGEGHFKNFPRQPLDAIPAPMNQAKKTLDENGTAGYKMKLIPKTQLDVVSKEIETKGYFTMPASAIWIADQSGGTLSPMAALQMQYEAYGEEMPNTDSAGKALEVEESIVNANGYSAFRKKMLNYKSNTTRTDISVIDGGGQAVYQQASPTQRKALDILAKYEVGNLGYDGMNQGGSDGGRTAHGSGSGTKILGKKITNMTIQELLDHGAAGRIHAAGRYQFIHSTLKEQVNRLGIPGNAKFSEAVQDYMALAYLNQIGWRGIWIGPTDKASPQEAAILDAARGQAVSGTPWRNPVNMRPQLLGAN